MPTSNANDGALDSLPGCSPALPGLACEARELKRIMASLAQQFAEADRRHSEALAKVHAKLGLLGDTTQDLRGRLPDEMTGVLDRIEDRMTKISDQISGSGPARKEAAGSSPAAIIAAAAAAPPPAPALRSALSVDALDAYNRAPRAGKVGTKPDVDKFDMVDSLSGDLGPHNWDQGAADALARLYEGGMNEDGMAPALDAVTASGGAGPDTTPLQNRSHSTAAVRLPVSEIAAEIAALQSKSMVSEREWLEQRFTDVAARLEQSLDGLSASGSLEAIEHRFAALEQRITEVMGDAAKRTDLASLKSIEAQVEDLNAQLYGVQSHFSRLDTIELELRALGERMSSDSIAKVIEQAKNVTPDSDALAGAVASRVVQQMPRIEEALQSIASQLSGERLADLVAEAKGPAQDPGSLARMVAEHVSKSMPQTARSQGDPIARIDELKEMLEAFVNERRHGDEQTSTMLDTMQQAMIRLLDRMDAIEQAQYDTGYGQATAEPDYGEPNRQTIATERDAAAYEATSAAPYSPPPRQEASADVALPPSSAPQVLRLDQQPAHAVAPQRPEEAAFAPTTGHEPAAAGGSRDDFIAAARRAARMAAETPVEPGPAVEIPLGATKAGDKTKGKTSGRQLSPLSLALLAAVVVGVSFVGVRYTLLTPKPAAPASAPGATAPAPARANTGAVKQAPNLEDADAPAEGERGQSGGARRSSLPGMGGGDNSSGQPGGLPLDVQKQIGGTLSLPAAFTKDELPGATAPRSNDLPPVSIGPNSLRNAAAKGDPSAEFEIGARFAEGRGVPQDLQQAVNWYQRAAAQGFAPAQYRLASMYERGLGVKTDLARARVWYQRAAEAGVVKAMHNMAVLTAGRDTALTDYQTAAKWFTAAAEHGLTDSQFNLAIMLDSGLGMERDSKQAYLWFSLAARAGDEEASRRRDALRSKLSPQELTAVEAQIASWRPRSADKALNDPRLAGEGWKSRAR